MGDLVEGQVGGQMGDKMAGEMGVKVGVRRPMQRFMFGDWLDKADEVQAKRCCSIVKAQ